MKAFNLLLTALLISIYSATLCAQLVDSEGPGKFFGSVNIDHPQPNLILSSDSTNTSSILYFNRQAGGGLNFARAQFAYLLSDDVFSFSNVFTPATFNDGIFTVDVQPGNGVQDGGGIISIGNYNAPHLTMDEFNIQARGVGGSTVEDLYINQYGGDILFASQTASTGKVGIGETAPYEKLTVDGKIAVVENGNNGHMVIANSEDYDHFSDPFIDFGGGDQPFIVASEEGSNEQAGIYGDGNALTLWSPGDGNYSLPAFLYILDEDLWSDADGNPYNNGAVQIYLDPAGTWQASDMNRKENITEFGNALDKIKDLKAYTYAFKQTAEEVAKNAPKTSAIGVMAQELHQVIPEAVSVSDEGEYFVNHSMLTPVLIQAINEQQTIIDNQVTIIHQMESRISALENRE